VERIERAELASPNFVRRNPDAGVYALTAVCHREECFFDPVRSLDGILWSARMRRPVL
jgi:hypothetical protein